LCCLTLLLAAGLAGCAAEGDFGRRQPSVVTDEVLPWAGRQLAWTRGEAVSGFMLTDDEKELRDRAWRFLMPAHPRSRFDYALAELRRLRLMPAGPRPGSLGEAPHRVLQYVGLGLYDDQQPDAYFKALMGQDWTSSHPPYRRLCGDIDADQALLDPLDAAAERVEAADRIRARGLPLIPDLSEGERDEALDRIAENQGLIWWITDALGRRVAGYRYALQRLFIEIPQRDAVACEHKLAGLEARTGAAPAASAPAVSQAAPRQGYYPWPVDETPPQK